MQVSIAQIQVKQNLTLGDHALQKIKCGNIGGERPAGRHNVGDLLHQIYIGQFHIAALVGVRVTGVVLQLEVGGVFSVFRYRWCSY